MKWHVFAMLVSAVVAFIGLAIITTQTEPETAPVVIKVLFFITLFVAIWGVSSSAGLWLRYRFGKPAPSLKLARKAAIYSLLTTAIIMASLLISRMF